MTNKFAGWLLGFAAFGMMVGLAASDIKELNNWAEARTPLFVGSQLAHFSTVIMAFMGGKLIPTEQNQRKDDDK